jgi:ABC-type nitrate/sulfonate/bicarbonate transport system substrate-binding protein
MFLEHEGAATRAELIELLLAKCGTALKNLESAKREDKDKRGEKTLIEALEELDYSPEQKAELIVDYRADSENNLETSQEIYNDILEAIEALNVSPEEKAAALAAIAARAPLKPATPEQIAEALAFLQQSDDPAIREMADYAVSLEKLTESSNEGTTH